MPDEYVALDLEMTGLRCILTAFKFYNTSRFIKKLSSFLRLSTQNLVNLTLTDNGIAFLSNTSIIKKLIDVLKTAERSID